MNISSSCSYLSMPWGCLQFVIAVFPEYTHLLFLIAKSEYDLQVFLNVLFFYPMS